MKFSKVLPLLVAGSFAHQALSQENTASSFYAGIELGVAQHSIDVSGAGANYEEETGNSFAPSLSFGYQFNENWSIVAQYTQYGEADLFDTDFEIPVDADIVPINVAFSTDTTGLSVVGQYMTERNVGHWSLGAKLGLMKWDTDLNIHYTSRQYGVDEVDTESDSGVAIYGGLLGAYALSETLDLTIVADWFVNDLDTELIDGATTDMQYSRFSVGMNYHW